MEYYNAFGGLALGVAVGYLAPKLGSVIRKIALIHYNESVKMVLVVRNDLGMGRGKIASQCAHAAIQCYQTSMKTDKQTLKLWLITGQLKVVVKVNTEEELLSIANASSKKGLVNCLIKDAGRTQLVPHTFTVLGIGPGKKEEIDFVTGHLKLL